MRYNPQLKQITNKKKHKLNNDKMNYFLLLIVSNLIPLFPKKFSSRMGLSNSFQHYYFYH